MAKSHNSFYASPHGRFLRSPHGVRGVPCLLPGQPDDEGNASLDGKNWPSFLRMEITSSLPRLNECHQDANDIIGSNLTDLIWFKQTAGDWNQTFYVERAAVIDGGTGYAYELITCIPKNVSTYKRFSDACTTEVSDPLELRIQLRVSGANLFFFGGLARSTDTLYIPSGGTQGYMMRRVIVFNRTVIGGTPNPDAFNSHTYAIGSGASLVTTGINFVLTSPANI